MSANPHECLLCGLFFLEKPVTRHRLSAKLFRPRRPINTCSAGKSSQRHRLFGRYRACYSTCVAFEDSFLKRPIGVATNRFLTDVNASLNLLDLESPQFAGQPFWRQPFALDHPRCFLVGIQSCRVTQNLLGWNQIALRRFSCQNRRPLLVFLTELFEGLHKVVQKRRLRQSLFLTFVDCLGELTAPIAFPFLVPADSSVSSARIQSGFQFCLSLPSENFGSSGS